MSINEENKVERPENEMVIDLDFEDGSSSAFAIVLSFETKEKDEDGVVKQYLSLAELDENEEYVGTIEFRRYTGDICGEMDIFDLESDQEYEMCCEIFDALTNADENAK